MLCISLTPAVLEDIFNSDLRLADCVEVRLDYLNDPEQSLNVSWKRLNLPVIITCLRVESGGLFKGTPEEERRLLERAVHNGAAFVDMDYRDARPITGAQIIGSYHNFVETPDDIQRHLEVACDNPVIQIGKVATTVRSWADNRRLLELLDRPWSKPVIVVGMGEMGQITRVIGKARGSYLTYATTDQPSGQPSALGQLSANELIHGYRYRRIQRTTKLFGVVGNPVTHSRGYLLHNRAFEATGANFAYLKFPVNDVRDFFEHARSIGIAGFSVTMPHKTAVIPYLSDMTQAAGEVGAVNTVFDQSGRWLGDNTDVHGAQVALGSIDFDPAGKRVVILGAGGASKAATVAVQAANSLVVLPRAQVTNGGDYVCDLLINATPVGMAPNVDASPVAGTIRADVVFDMVYTPPKTRLLKLAEEQGKRVIPGTTMFYAQAARQFEIWTGQPAPAGLYPPENTT
jgi:3-dehydroquinate dehydratase/shikimate dehydrogenase